MLFGTIRTRNHHSKFLRQGLSQAEQQARWKAHPIEEFDEDELYSVSSGRWRSCDNALYLVSVYGARMAGPAINPVQVISTLSEFLRLWTGFELSSSWSNLPCCGVNLNRNILDFMR
jgi:hypothetical protein